MQYSIKCQNGRIVLRIEGEYDYQDMMACFVHLAEIASQNVCHTLVLDTRDLNGDADISERTLLANYFGEHISILNIIILVIDEQNPDARHFGIALNNQGYWIRKISDENLALRFLDDASSNNSA